MELYDEFLEKALIQDPPRVLCAWHPKYFGEEFVMRDGPEDRVSHSICEQCKTIFNDEEMRGALENCPHTDSVRWSANLGRFVCDICEAPNDFGRVVSKEDAQSIAT